MSIDVQQLFSSMAQSAKDTLGEGGEVVSQELISLLESSKSGLAELAKARASGLISQLDFEREVEREKQVLEAELIALEIQAKVAIQKAVNAAADTFKAALSAAV